MHGEALFTVDVEHRRLWSVSLTTGERRVEAEDLAVGLPRASNAAPTRPSSPTAWPRASPASPRPRTAP
ncbi:hypothetical protein [Streptomyces iakyrus]|uniref:hypothetical protein n=1 Tax=Streptomyces iakyrus TaxID=68219 RepID=UPI0036F62AD2